MSVISLYYFIDVFFLYNKKNIYTAAWRYEFYFLVAKIILPLENKSHIFAPPCNILYVLYCIVTQTFVTLPPKQKKFPFIPEIFGSLMILIFFDHSVMFTCSKVNVFTFGGAKRGGSDRECKYFPIGMNARDSLWR